MDEHFEDGEKVILLETGELETVKRWSRSRNPGGYGIMYTYDLVGHPGTFYFHHELKKQSKEETNHG